MTTQDVTRPDEPTPDEGGSHVLPGMTAAGSAARSGRGRALVVGVAVAVLAAAGVGAAVLVSSSDDGGTGPLAAATRTVRTAVAPVATPVATVAGVLPTGLVPWQSPLSVTATSGTITAVTGAGPDGTPLSGTLAADGSWTSTTGLVPATTYPLVAVVRDAAGETHRLPLTAATTPPDKTFDVKIAPGDTAVVGVGQAISVRLPMKVTDPTVRRAVESRLTVTTVPPVAGAWRWMSSTELRYRGADYWPAHTAITVTAAMGQVQASPGVWGAATRTSTFTVGDALTSVVDTQAHTMTVSLNGQVVRTMKASMGKPQFATRNGNFVVLEKFADRVMDSATVDLPPGTPAYRTAVKDAVRITNSGTFTHGAPWSVSSQGVRNVSHGCINLSPVDADWYYNQAKRGDVVTVVNSTTGPNLSDAGSQDWNMSFETWKSGSALA